MIVQTVRSMINELTHFCHFAPTCQGEPFQMSKSLTVGVFTYHEKKCPLSQRILSSSFISFQNGVKARNGGGRRDDRRVGDKTECKAVCSTWTSGRGEKVVN